MAIATTTAWQAIPLQQDPRHPHTGQANTSQEEWIVVRIARIFMKNDPSFLACPIFSTSDI
jgi:hypothetical protein